MDFSLATEHEILRNSVRNFALHEIQPLAQDLDEREEFSVELTMAMGNLGLFGMVIPEDYGGQGLDYLGYIIAVEELARADGSQAATVAAANSLGIGPIYEFGSEEQKRKYLPQLCSGQALWGFGLTEPNAGSDAGNTQTTAVLDGMHGLSMAVRYLSPMLPRTFPLVSPFWLKPECGRMVRRSLAASWWRTVCPVMRRGR